MSWDFPVRGLRSRCWLCLQNSMVCNPNVSSKIDNRGKRELKPNQNMEGSLKEIKERGGA